MNLLLLRNLLCLVCISTSSHAVSTCSDERSSSFYAERRQNFYLGCDSVVKSLQTSNSSDCVGSCVRNPVCFSSNFKKSNSKCELLKSTRKTTPDHCFSWKEKWEYLEVMNQTNCGGRTPCVHKEALQDGWYSFNGTKLKHFRERKTWGEAKSYCQSIGGNLVTISSELMNTFVDGIIPFDAAAASMKPEHNLDIIGYWKLDGTDPDVTLFGATYQTVEGHKSLYLNGSTYATVPAFTLTPDFTIMMWVRIPEVPSTVNFLFADWSSPWTFSFCLDSAGDSFFLQLRNKVNQELMSGGFLVEVPKQTWVHLTLTMNKTTKKTAGYVNGVIKGTLVSSFTGDWTYQTNSHTVYDIGLKRDGSNTFFGFIRDLTVFNKALSLDEINIYMQNKEQRGTWTGLNDINKEGSFTWSDRSAVSFVNWFPDQPNAFNYLEDCVKFDGSQWDDFFCGALLSFVCQKP